MPLSLGLDFPFKFRVKYIWYKIEYCFMILSPIIICLLFMKTNSSCSVLTYYNTVDGEWSHWTFWGDCHAEECSMTPGSRVRWRSCTAPSPQHGGHDCRGKATQRQDCFNFPDHCQSKLNYICTEPYICNSKTWKLIVCRRRQRFEFFVKLKLSWQSCQISFKKLDCFKPVILFVITFSSAFRVDTVIEH